VVGRASSTASWVQRSARGGPLTEPTLEPRKPFDWKAFHLVQVVKHPQVAPAVATGGIRCEQSKAHWVWMSVRGEGAPPPSSSSDLAPLSVARTRVAKQDEFPISATELLDERALLLGVEHERALAQQTSSRQ
jgi:hypothetical protein